MLLVNSEEASDACTLNGQQLLSQAEDQMLRNRLLDMVNCMHAHLYSMYFAYIYNMLYTSRIQYIILHISLIPQLLHVALTCVNK